jgi:uncharacterized membrane protein YphA (DoxX/SURF4 family)
MAVSRRIARPLLASVFVVGGIDALRNPDTKAERADAVVGPLSERLGTDPEVLVRANGAIQVGAGVLLATGKFRRVASLALIGSIIPTTLGGHRFWDETDPAARSQQKMQFFKNLGLLGGLILAAFDTEGEPSLGWRAKRRAHQLETAIALGRAASTSKVRRVARKSKAAGTHAANSYGSALNGRIDLDSLQNLAASGAAAAHLLPSSVPDSLTHLLPSSVPDSLKSAGAVARKLVQESSGSAAEVVHQAPGAVGAAVGHLGPLADSVTRAGIDTIGPYLSIAAEKAIDLSKRADRLAITK